VAEIRNTANKGEIMRLGGPIYEEYEHLDEVRPGRGSLDYRTFFREISRLEDDIPFMFEHLENREEYAAAADHLRGIAANEGIDL